MVVVPKKVTNVKRVFERRDLRAGRNGMGVFRLRQLGVRREPKLAESGVDLDSLLEDQFGKRII